jgi:hypothetical protein
MRINTRRQAGFVLITALGVLVLLMIMAFSSAVTVEFTNSFSRARSTDREYGRLLRDSAQLLSQHQLASPGTPKELLRTTTLSKQDVQVSATLLMPEIGNVLLGQALKPRAGDQVVELALAPLSTGKIARGAVYLVNNQGARGSAILLQDKRP